MALTNEEKISALKSITALDVDCGLKNVMNMAPVYLRILGVFVKNARKDKEQLDEFAKATDLDGFGVLIHGYKSSLKNVGALDLGDAAAALEAADTNADTAFIMANLPTFTSSIEDLASKIEQILE